MKLLLIIVLNHEYINVKGHGYRIIGGDYLCTEQYWEPRETLVSDKKCIETFQGAIVGLIYAFQMS